MGEGRGGNPAAGIDDSREVRTSTRLEEVLLYMSLYKFL